MNEDLLELSSIISKLESKNEVISVVLMDLAKEFASEEKVSIQELIFKLVCK